MPSETERKKKRRNIKQNINRISVVSPDLLNEQKSLDKKLRKKKRNFF